MQTLTYAGWKELWPRKDLHLNIRHMLGNLTLLPSKVNIALGNKGLMHEALAAHKQGPVSFKITSDLTEGDWVLESFVARHQMMVRAIALRLGLATGRLGERLPKIGTNPVAGCKRLENTDLWK